MLYIRIRIKAFHLGTFLERKYQFSTHTHIGKLVPLSPVVPTTPNRKGVANQGPDRVGIPLVVDPIFGASTGPSMHML